MNEALDRVAFIADHEARFGLLVLVGWGNGGMEEEVHDRF